MLTRLIAQSGADSEPTVDYEYEYRDAEYEYRDAEYEYDGAGKPEQYDEPKSHVTVLGN